LGLVLVDYEGNLYGALNMRCFADHLHHAAARQAARYSTVARMALPREALRVVGSYDLAAKRFVCTDPEALAAWVAPETIEAADGGPATSP
jgi:hypothetical protein